MISKSKTVLVTGATDGLGKGVLRFAVNYLSHYLLTRELLPLLKRSAPARIVNVSSAGQAAIDFSDPMLTRLVVDPSLANVSGKYFDGLNERLADAQAYDARARSELRALSERLVSAVP